MTGEVQSEVVYHLSPDRQSELRTSLESLFDSGSTVERVTAYLWGADESDALDLDALDLAVKPVKPLFGDFPYANVVYASWSEAPRVIYLDVDTIVLRPLDELWADRHGDVLARVGTAYELRKWRQDIWEETFSRHGSAVVPMFNTGLVVFQHGAQHRLRDLWERYTWAYLRGEETAPWHDWRLPQQHALSLAVGIAGVNYSLLSAKEHAFGWTNESYSEAVVLHTGNERHAELVAELNARSGRNHPEPNSATH